MTRPTPAMRDAMVGAEVGDDVMGEDPTVNRLEAVAAERLGKEAAIFVPSGTQSNLLALLSHCQRGEEYIVGQTAHTYKYEAGGAAVLGSIQPQPLDFEPGGRLNLERVARAIKPDDPHFAKTRLLCLENTQDGQPLPMDYLQEAADLAREHGLALHLDGARIFNAAVRLGVSAEAIARPFDSVSVCLSKGLGAPVGSVLCASGELIDQARRWRKMLGGGMRQAGILAAAGLHALEHHVDRLAEDHAHAAILADGLAEMAELQVRATDARTNMIFVRVGPRAAELATFLKQRDIRTFETKTLRLVTHLDVSESDVRQVVEAFREFFAA